MNPFQCGTIAHDVLASRGFGNNCDKEKPKNNHLKKHHVITIDIENLRKCLTPNGESE